MNKKIRIILLAISILFITWIIYMADNNQKSIFFDLVRAIPFGDKLGHITLFGILTLVINIALNFKRSQFLISNVYLGTLIVTILVLFEEISQYFIVYRTFDVYDLLADACGILLFHFISVKIESKIRR